MLLYRFLLFLEELRFDCCGSNPSEPVGDRPPLIASLQIVDWLLFDRFGWCDWAKRRLLIVYPRRVWSHISRACLVVLLVHAVVSWGSWVSSHRFAIYVQLRFVQRVRRVYCVVSIRLRGDFYMLVILGMRFTCGCHNINWMWNL